jgi:hypothetical protein
LRTERPGLKETPLFADEVLILRRLLEGRFWGFPALPPWRFARPTLPGNSKQQTDLVATFVPHVSSNGGTR